MEVFETLPIVPLRDVVVFPHMMMPFVIGRPSRIALLERMIDYINGFEGVWWATLEELVRPTSSPISRRLGG